MRSCVDCGKTKPNLPSISNNCYCRYRNHTLSMVIFVIFQLHAASICSYPFNVVVLDCPYLRLPLLQAAPLRLILFISDSANYKQFWDQQVLSFYTLGKENIWDELGSNPGPAATKVTALTMIPGTCLLAPKCTVDDTLIAQFKSKFWDFKSKRLLEVRELGLYFNLLSSFELRRSKNFFLQL